MANADQIDITGQAFTDRYYVDPSKGLVSLGTVRAANIILRTVRNSYSGIEEIRVDFTDIRGNAMYDVKFVSVDRVNPEERTEQLIGCKVKYVRVSLARKFKPNGWPMEACILQISNMYGF